MKKLINKIFGDIFMLYKNFWHFNLSKILIFLVSIFYAFLSSIPFLLIGAGIYYYFQKIGTVNAFGNNFFAFILFYLNYYIGVLFAFVGFVYSFVLFIKLSFKYIKGKKLELKKNYYFDFKLFFKFFKLFLLNLLIILSPFLIFLILIFILVFALGGVGIVNDMILNSQVNIFSISSFILFIISFICFIYLSYKTLFSTIILVDEYKGKKLEKVNYYIKKSFKLTKGFKVAFRFIISFLLVFLCSFIIIIPNNYFDKESHKLANYLYYLKHKDEIEKFDYNYLLALQKDYGNKTEAILEKEFKKDFYLYILFEVLFFLFVIGLFEMFLVSFYKRELKK